VTPEDVLGALVTHSQAIDLGKPDPLMLEAREGKTGKARPTNWRLLVGKRPTDDKLKILPSIRSALGKQTRQPTSYSVATVAADAFVGMPVRNWHTLQCAIGVGDSVRPILANKLLRIANRMKERERVWPATVRRRQHRCGHFPSDDYVRDLVELSLRELQDPFVYKTARAKLLWFGVSEALWHARIRHPYDQVASHVWSWYYAGIGYIQNRIIENSRAT